jgi:hypothetical protein
MHMPTITETPATRKPKAYFAQYDGIPGILSKPGDTIIFFDPATQTVIPMTEANPPLLIVLGNVETWMADYYADLQARITERRAA